MSPAPDRVSPIEIDARGLRCPLPVIRLAQAARDAPAGMLLVVLATDPAARYDIPAWCRMRGHEICEVKQVGEPIQIPGRPGLTGSPGTGNPPAGSDAPPYLRFVVRLGS